jgi:hypothetical protein
MSAAELMAELQKDPDFVARARRREQQSKQNVEVYTRAAAPILKELAARGFPVSSIGELRQRKLDYRPVIGLLLHWLPRIADWDVKEDIVRTLSVPWAKPQAAAVFVEEFRKTPEGSEAASFRWAIGNGLSIVADDAVFDDLVELARDTRFGRAREMLALALGNIQNPRAIDVLMRLLEDDEMVGHAVVALGNLKATAARERLMELTQHPKMWIRNGAKKALARIDRSGLH